MKLKKRNEGFTTTEVMARNAITIVFVYVVGHFIIKFW